VVGYVVNPGPSAQFQLYVTGSNVQGQNPNQIASYLDNGAYNGGLSSGNFSTLAFVGAVGGSPNGNENFAGLAFAPGYHTSSALASSANPAPQGQPVTFTVTVAAPSGTPTGVVAFYDGSAFLGTGTLDANGVATFTVSTLTAGDHSITAFYYGDVTDGTSTSDVLTETISGGGQAPSPPNRIAVDFLLRAEASNATAITQSNYKSSSTLLVAGQMPIMTDRGSNLSDIGAAESRLGHNAEPATRDTFWQLLGPNDQGVASLWRLD
jgi:Bacterial Ig-like domain (group 3)